MLRVRSIEYCRFGELSGFAFSITACISNLPVFWRLKTPRLFLPGAR
jgi:hypothetical protein